MAEATPNEVEAVEGDGETAETPPEPTSDTGAHTPTKDAGSGEASSELERLRAQLADYEPIVQAHKDATEVRQNEEQTLREELASLKHERDSATQDLMRREIAEEAGIPASIARHLSGPDRDALLAAAKEIAEHMTAPRVGARPFPTVGGSADAVKSDEDPLDPLKLAQAVMKRARF